MTWPPAALPLALPPAPPTLIVPPALARLLHKAHVTGKVPVHFTPAPVKLVKVRNNLGQLVSMRANRYQRRHELRKI